MPYNFLLIMTFFIFISISVIPFLTFCEKCLEKIRERSVIRQLLITMHFLGGGGDFDNIIYFLTEFLMDHDLFSLRYIDYSCSNNIQYCLKLLGKICERS